MLTNVWNYMHCVLISSRGPACECSPFRVSVSVGRHLLMVVRPKTWGGQKVYLLELTNTNTTSLFVTLCSASCLLYSKLLLFRLFDHTPAHSFLHYFSCLSLVLILLSPNLPQTLLFPPPTPSLFSSTSTITARSTCLHLSKCPGELFGF